MTEEIYYVEASSTFDEDVTRELHTRGGIVPEGNVPKHLCEDGEKRSLIEIPKEFIGKMKLLKKRNLHWGELNFFFVTDFRDPRPFSPDKKDAKILSIEEQLNNQMSSSVTERIRKLGKKIESIEGRLSGASYT